MDYKGLRKGWLPYNELFQKYKPKTDQFRFINKIPDASKEQIGKTWIVKEKKFLETANLNGVELENGKDE